LARDGIAVDVITGGFPCQDLSVAGKRAGLGEGTRSGLWSEIVRLIGELSPRYVIVENVANLLSGPSEKRGGWFGRVLGDLAECGYDAEWENIPASALGAPHRRERIWIVAWPAIGRDLADANENYARRAPDAGVGLTANKGREGVAKRRDSLADADCERGCGWTPWHQDAKDAWQSPGYTRHDGSGVGQWVIEPNVGRVAYGVPNRAHRLAGLGNAVVPQIPELIGHAILQSEASHA
jgi:DNA (cytosine-5)-methyltransferase 1